MTRTPSDDARNLSVVKALTFLMKAQFKPGPKPA